MTRKKSKSIKPDDVKSDAPWFKFFPEAWLSSQDVLLMTSDERGQYIHLLAVCWSDENCSIPEDDSAMALLCGCHDISDKVRSKFVPHPYKKDALTNPRLMAERVEQVAFKKTKSLAGAKGARVRWQSHGYANGRTKGDGSAIDLPMPKSMANDSYLSIEGKPLRPALPDQESGVSKETFDL